MAIAGTHQATVHVLAQSCISLAAGAATHASPSPSPRLLLASGLPGHVPGESHCTGQMAQAQVARAVEQRLRKGLQERKTA
jgi:hypothetical protein